MFGFRRTRAEPSAPNGVAAQPIHPANTIAATDPPALPDWQAVLTGSLEENCLAPSDEAIAHAFDLYCDEMAAPFHARAEEMAEIYAGITGGISDLQLLAPGLLDALLGDPSEPNSTHSTDGDQ